jgi:RNA polymerase sigma factor (sigma-70 family)
VLSKTPPLDVQSEFHHALELYRSRVKVASCVLELPVEIRGSVLDGDPDGPSRGVRWPLEQVETCCNRLAKCEVPEGDTRLRQRLLVIKQQKRRMDQSRDTLIMASLRFVPHVAKNFSHPGISFMDLVQEGNVGLLKAVDRFDPKRGYRFSTYAYWWIRQAISKAVAEKSRVIRFPEHAMALISRLKRATNELSEELGRRPSTVEIADRMQVSTRRVDDLLAMILNPYPLDGPEGEFEEPEFLSNLIDPGAKTPLEAALNREQQEEIVAALNQLSPRERQIVNLRFGMEGGEGHTLDEIGVIVGLSRERVRQILNEALGKLHDRGEVVLPMPRSATGAGRREPEGCSAPAAPRRKRYTSVIGRGITPEEMTQL